MVVFNKVLLVLHFLGLAMGLSAGFANMAMVGLIKKAAPPEKPILGRFPPVMGRVGRIGLVLLWVTGLTMLFTRWSGFKGMPWTFHAKFTAVVLLTVVVGYIQSLEIKMRKSDPAAGASIMPRIESAGKVAMLLAVIVVIFAVLTFN